MPIYEYQCQVCGHRFDQLQKISDPNLTDCPECGKASLQRLISPAGFQLKGTGWYVTDFRNNDKPKSAKPADATTTTSTEKSGDKTAATPADSSSAAKSEE